MEQHSVLTGGCLLEHEGCRQSHLCPGSSALSPPPPGTESKRLHVRQGEASGFEGGARYRRTGARKARLPHLPAGSTACGAHPCCPQLQSFAR
jgi:hypothetical protein